MSGHKTAGKDGWYAHLLHARQARPKANENSRTEDRRVRERGETIGDWVYFYNPRRPLPNTTVDAG
jgi:hypothetical protein